MVTRYGRGLKLEPESKLENNHTHSSHVIKLYWPNKQAGRQVLIQVLKQNWLLENQNLNLKIYYFWQIIPAYQMCILKVVSHCKAAIPPKIFQNIKSQSDNFRARTILNSDIIMYLSSLWISYYYYLVFLYFILLTMPSKNSGSCARI